MEIVEFQGGKYHLLADGMGGFTLSPLVEYVAKPCSLAQTAAEFKAERQAKEESQTLGRIAHKGQEWDIVADSLGLKLVLVEEEKMVGTAPTDATHYCPINDAFVKIIERENFLGYDCYYQRGGQWVLENPVRFSALLSLTEVGVKVQSVEPEENCNGCEAVRYPTASEINDQAMKHIRDRASTYDQPQGERSMGKIVIAFNAITGRDLTESEGWLLLQVLKDVRQWRNPNEYHQDSGEDCIAYAALKAESLAGGR